MWNHGLDIERIPLSARCLVPQEYETVRSQTKSSFLSWRRKLIPRSLFHLVQFPSSLMPRRWIASDYLEWGSPSLYFEILRRRNLAIIQEDKDPTILWAQSLPGLAWRWLKQQFGASDRWSILPTSLTPILTLYRMMYDTALPMNIHRASGHSTAFHTGHIPTTKPLIIRKCWLNSQNFV